jgi:hypothetical protein
MINLKIAIAFLSLALALTTRAAAAAGSSDISSITLERTEGESPSPAYTLTLTDGCAELHGRSNFALIGDFIAPFDDFDQAVKSVESHHFFSFREEYPILKDGEGILDAPETVLRVVRKNGLDTQVRATGSSGIPSQLEELFHIIDGYGFTAYWFHQASGQPVANVHNGGEITMSPTDKPCIANAGVSFAYPTTGSHAVRVRAIAK